MKSTTVALLLLIVFTLSFHRQSLCEDSNKSSDPNNSSARYIIKPVKVDVSGMQITKRKVPEGFDQCGNCHTQKSRRFLKKEANPQRAHEKIKNLHGKREMSCNSCHDINNRNFLLSSKSKPADFTNSSPVCAQCHHEKFRDWKKGLHGKRLGGWIKPLEQLQCIDCHSPHSVSFGPMEALPPQYQSPFIIPHNDVDNENEKTEQKKAVPSTER